MSRRPPPFQDGDRRSIKGLTSIFVLTPSGESNEPVLSEIPQAAGYDPARKRRAHTKSRIGCENCRRRRVKCNEGLPCSNCLRRGDNCKRGAHRSELTLCPRVPAATLTSDIGSSDSPANLLHMKLFHHFQQHTRASLLIAPGAWDHAIQLSFQCDFLMDALLGLAARHLSILNPEDVSYQTTAAARFCRASSKLRREITKDDPSSIHFDSFIATSILFYYYAWTSTDYYSPLEEEECDLSKLWTDGVFGFSNSLKRTMVSVFQNPAGQPSVFRKHLLYDPSATLTEALQNGRAQAASFEHFFCYRREISLDMLDEPRTESVEPSQASSAPGVEDASQFSVFDKSAEDVYDVAVQRFCLLLPFLSDRTSAGEDFNDSSSLQSAIARYILSFPLFGWGRFPMMVEQGDAHALLILYHFYRTVNLLLSDSKEWWWAQARASVAERVLRRRLISAVGNRIEI